MGVRLYVRLHLAGFVYVAFVIDVFARRIVGRRVCRAMRADFVLDALERALYVRQPERNDTLIHHFDRGSQYVSTRYTERLAEAGIEPSVGSRGDSHDNALAETINGLYKAELIHRRAPWKTMKAVELATLEWVSWLNHQRLLGSIGYIPPAEAEDDYYRQRQRQRLRHWQRECLNQSASTEAGTIQMSFTCLSDEAERLDPLAISPHCFDALLAVMPFGSILNISDPAPEPALAMPHVTHHPR